MSLQVSINTNSLNTIREELDNTLNHAATDFESYLADQKNSGNLDSSREAIGQVGGTFRLLEYAGAALIADELKALLDVVAESGNTSDATINAATHAFFVLPRYIEYVSIKHFDLPILVIPYVNEMRASRRAPMLAEREYFKGEVPAAGKLQPPPGSADIAALVTASPRLRSMYQTGLVGVINDPKPTAHFQFMQRSLTRFLSMLGGRPEAEIWQLAAAVVEAFASDSLEVTLNRKRVLADVEKLMRVVVSEGEKGLQAQPRQGLKEDLLFLLMLSKAKSAEIDAIRRAYAMPDVGMDDDAIRAHRNAMHGPSLDTLESVISVLKEELRSAKDILEVAAQNNGMVDEDASTLREVIARVGDTLKVLNLSGPESTLREQLAKIDAWTEEAGREEFLETADTVLYVESALSSLDRRELTVEDLNQATELTRKKIVAGSQLAEAERLVLEEAQSGIALSKRAITSYVDSNFDAAHIINVATTLRTVRGGLKILNYDRAAAVLKSCADFVSENTKSGNAGTQRHQLLETLADALISLEYYLSELESSRQVNEKILEVAEESLAALGYAVEK